MTEKWPKKIDQIMKNSSRRCRSIKKIQLFMGERYPLHIYCYRTENP